MIKVNIKTDNFKSSVQKDFNKAVGEIADELYVKIVERNPVDTGFSSANWNGSYDTPDFSVRGTKEKVPGIENRIYGQPVPVGTKSLHLSNGVEYIEELEYGHSNQAPSGFVGLSVSEIEAKHS